MVPQLLRDGLLAEGGEANLTGHSTINVGGLDSIVVGSWPSLHDAHGYKPSVLHQYLSNHVTQATLKIAHNYVYYYVSYNILMFSHYLRHVESRISIV